MSLLFSFQFWVFRLIWGCFTSKSQSVAWIQSTKVAVVSPCCFIGAFTNFLFIILSSIFVINIYGSGSFYVSTEQCVASKIGQIKLPTSFATPSWNKDAVSLLFVPHFCCVSNQDVCVDDWHNSTCQKYRYRKVSKLHFFCFQTFSHRPMYRNAASTVYDYERVVCFNSVGGHADSVQILFENDSQFFIFHLKSSAFFLVSNFVQ